MSFCEGSPSALGAERTCSAGLVLVPSLISFWPFSWTKTEGEDTGGT